MGTIRWVKVMEGDRILNMFRLEHFEEETAEETVEHMQHMQAQVGPDIKIILLSHEEGQKHETKFIFSMPKWEEAQQVYGNHVGTVLQWN